LVSFGDAISDETSAAVLALDRALADEPPTGFAECVPAFVNLLIDHAQLRQDVERVLHGRVRDRVTGQWREVEVCYEDEFGPDVGAVATSTGLSIDEVIKLHLQADYQVRMYGFAPGYAYMSGVPLAMQVPRKPAAVRNIPAGSVLVAGPQCLVTTLTMPTGWSVIGRSPTRILSRDESSPFLFDVGDKVRFKRVDRAQFETRTGGAR
jgi:inhibitor of KinA